jgi:hypothetical protein
MLTESLNSHTKHPSEAYEQIFITLRQLLLYWCEALSLTRGQVCRLQLLLVLASAVILGSEPVGLATIFYCIRFETFLPGDPNIDHHLEHFVLFCLPLPRNVLTEPLASNELPLWFHYSGIQAVLTKPLPSNDHISHNSAVSKSELPTYKRKMNVACIDHRFLVSVFFSLRSVSRVLISFDAFLLNSVDTILQRYNYLYIAE